MIGARVLRVEDGRLLKGRGRFVADFVLPHMLHCAFLRSPYAHARILSIHRAAAMAVPGVRAVLIASDLPPIGLFNVRIPGLGRTPQPILAADQVRFAGEAVALVIAADRYVAEDAADLVEVAYEPLPVVREPSERPDGWEPLFPELPDDVVFDRASSFGDPDAAFATAAAVYEGTFRSNRHAASPMETRGCIAQYDPTSARLDFWSSTQGPHPLRRKLADALGMNANDIRVHIHDVGGAFGQKVPVSPEEVAVACASRKLGSPVKWIEDRRENLLAAPHSRDQTIVARIAVGAQGNFLGLKAQFVGDAGAYSFNAATALSDIYLAARILPGPYRILNYEYRATAHLTNKAPQGAYRGMGMVAAQTARELLIDDVARGLGIDRVELRLRNLVAKSDMPFTSAVGMRFENNSFQESLRRSAELVGYPDLLAEQERLRAEGRHLGIGFSPFVEATGFGREIEGQFYGHPHAEYDAATVSLDTSGAVTVLASLTSQGQGLETALAQVAADVLSVPLHDVKVSFTDTDSAPLSLTGTRASRSAVVAGGAVGLAALELRERIRTAAALILGCSPDDLVLEAGRVRAKGATDRDLTLRQIVQATTENTEVQAAMGGSPLAATRSYDPGLAFANGCMAAVVEVDAATGAVRVKKVAAVHDSGTEINPMIVDGQVMGGIVQGIGTALLERIVYDGDGSLRTATFMDYLLPTSTDLPDIVLASLASPAPGTWRGIKGVGESGVIGTPAAVATAVGDALSHLGVRVRSLPLWPEDVLDAIDAGAASA